MEVSVFKISVEDKQKHKKILLDWEDIKLIKTALAVLWDQADEYHRDFLLEEYDLDLEQESEHKLPKHLQNISEEVCPDKIMELSNRIFD
jgi:hypothetical protein